MNIDINPLVDSIKIRFRRIQPKERKLIRILIVIVFVTLYLNGFMRPVITKIGGFIKQQKELKAKTKILVSQYPDVDKIKREVEAVRKDINNLKNRGVEVEARLINTKQIPRVLDALIKAAGGLTIVFESVKQHIETDKNSLQHLYIDLRFESTYEAVANYIKNIEEISPYMKIKEMDLLQSKKDPRNLINVFLRTEALLALTPDARGELALVVSPRPKINIARSPLMAQVAAQIKKETLKLSGITYRAQKALSAAIINDAVVKVGDKINHQSVEDIQPDAVVVNDGIEKTILKVER